jgi:hypothetical protein
MGRLLVSTLSVSLVNDGKSLQMVNDGVIPSMNVSKVTSAIDALIDQIDKTRDSDAADLSAIFAAGLNRHLKFS